MSLLAFLKIPHDRHQHKHLPNPPNYAEDKIKGSYLLLLIYQSCYSSIGGILIFNATQFLFGLCSVV